jgi:GT2 family glycosyltransferase
MQAPESAPRASILIVTASAGQRLRRCLECLAAATPAVEHETIVVVNGAGADVAAEIRGFAGAARVEHSEVNIGLAGALNRGRSLAGGEFVVLLHDDAEVGAGWLEGLVAAAERDPGAGAVGSLVLDREGRVSAAGWQLLPDGTTRPPWDVEPPSAAEFRGVRAVDYCGTCSLLVRASTWDRVGGADETLYPLYYVDVDLCLGIRARGERILCEPASVVVHLGGASTTHDFALFATARNRVRLLEKWGPLVTSHLAGSGATFRLEPAALPVQGRESDPLARERETAREFAADQRRRLAARATEVSALHEHLASFESARDGLARELERALVEVRARDAAMAELDALAAARNAGLAEIEGLTAARDAGLAEIERLTAARDAGLAELEALSSARDALARELDRALAEVGARDAALADLEARAVAETARAGSAEVRAAVIEGELASLASEALWLRGRAETLARVEAGGWWRLRGRIRPVLVAARALERYVRRLRR